MSTLTEQDPHREYGYLAVLDVHCAAPAAIYPDLSNTLDPSP